MATGSDFEYFALNWFKIFTRTAEMKKLRSGYLLKEILDHFARKAQSTLVPDRSMWMYFAHDITLANMLNSLGLYEVNSLCVHCFFFLLMIQKLLFIFSASFSAVRILPSL